MAPKGRLAQPQNRACRKWILLIQKLMWGYAKIPHNKHSYEWDSSHGNSFIRHCSVCHGPRHESTSWHKCTTERWSTAYSRLSCETWAPDLPVYTRISKRNRGNKIWFHSFRCMKRQSDVGITLWYQTDKIMQCFAALIDLPEPTLTHRLIWYRWQRKYLMALEAAKGRQMS